MTRTLKLMAKTLAGMFVGGTAGAQDYPVPPAPSYPTQASQIDPARLHIHLPETDSSSREEGEMPVVSGDEDTLPTDVVQTTLTYTTANSSSTQWLKNEEARLSRYKAWLDNRTEQLNAQTKALTRRINNTTRLMNAFRCTHGLNVYNCGCGQGARYMNTIISPAVQRDRSASRANDVAWQRLKDFRRSYASQMSNYRQKLSASRNTINPSRRSPDEGLFIDESAPRVR